MRYLNHPIAAMFRGEIVEWGEGSQITADPQRPYTKRLLMASPVADPDRQQARREHRRELIASGALVVD